MIRRIRNSFWTKVVAAYIAINLLAEIVFPTMSLALTSGPVGIDQASFEPAATSEMVNLATGDFTYNIPLMDVDGYPINLSYHGDINMEQEASIVGLGWTINVGAMNRMKRGLPDDFKGDQIITEMNLRPKANTGVKLGVNVEFLGYEPPSSGEFLDGAADILSGSSSGGPSGSYTDDLIDPSVGGSIGINFDNYVGYGLDLGVTGGVSGGAVLGKKGSFYNAGIGLGLESSSQNGLSIDPYLNASVNVPKTHLQVKLGIGTSINSVQGLQNFNTTAGIGVDMGKAVIGVKTAGIIQVSSVTYTPTISFETNTKMQSYDFDLGNEFVTVYTNGKATVYKSLTCLESNVQEVKGYGYLYEGLQDQQSTYLLDFNREGTVLPSKHIAYLPATNHTYDVYSATGQGLGFSSRPFRSDVLVVSDPYRTNDINGFGLSGELGFPAPPSLFQAGLNLHFSDGYVRTGNWTNNPLNDKLTLNPSPGALYENFYFKKFENRSSSNSDYIVGLLGSKAIRQHVVESGVNHAGTNVFHSYFDFFNGTLPDVLDLDAAGVNTYKQERDLRNTNIQYLTAEEADDFAINEIYSYNIETSAGYVYTGKEYPKGSAISRYGTLSTDAKKHHLSEMTVLEGDGSRYVYGIPVINSVTKEVMFNVSEKHPDILNICDPNCPSHDCASGLVTYQSEYSDGTITYAGDNSTNNRRGDNNLFISNTLPAYATSYLLTAYLSSNYQDLSGDGPTQDDLGNYTKFNYAKSENPTKWRFPFDEDVAAYNEGLKANDYDDMGSYVYGERDQWNLHSIESKNFVAEFHYLDRHDGYSVAGENGGIGVNNSKKLDHISLYTREGKERGEPPIKTVHFVYDYSLCQGVPNNDGQDPTNNAGGKLTLTSIYFTYGNSNRGKLHQYEFDYDQNNALSNPDYAQGKVNRWGTYTSQNPNGGCDFDDPLTNLEYPYANQDQATADQDAAAWMLRGINLPSGSRLDFEFESDDYSYVQDQEASRMFKILGVSNDGDPLNDSEFLYDQNGDNNYLHVDLGNELDGLNYDQASAIFKSEYVGDLTELYFRFLIDVSDSENPLTEYEYVSGYAEIDPNNIYVDDVDPGTPVKWIGLIRLKSVHIKDKDKEPSGSHGIHPISKASWQFTRKYLPNIINPIVGDIYTGNDVIPYGHNCDVPDVVPNDPDDDDPSPPSETMDEGSGFTDLYNLGVSQMQNLLSFGGINFMMKARGYSTHFEPEKSWIRLYQGRSNKKLGGGHRVRKIEVTDNWNDVKSNELTSVYGTQYSYSKIENNGVISSGVAYYEPITSGGDENTMRRPVHYNVDVKFRVNDEEFQERPLVESFVASTEIVYSEVTVKNINYSNVTQNATGKTVYEFYTARDFPLIVETTNQVDNYHLESKSSGWSALFTGQSFNYLTMSQGYSVQLNDMHGKFKSKKVFAETSEINSPVIYSLEHLYYKDPSNAKLLKNDLNVVNESGVISTKYIGKDMDMVVDLNQSKSFQESNDNQFGLEVQMPFIPIPSFWLTYSSQENIFRSSVTTKVVYSNGILEQIKLTDKGRSKYSKNILFDEKTGVPVVTEIMHESGADALPIYQYDYPAYWVYDGMGLATENWKASFSSIADANGKIVLANYKDFLNPGDELAVSNSTGTVVKKWWVIEDESSLTDEYYVIDEFGDIPGELVSSTNYTYKVIRSGKRNILGATVASVTSLDHAFFNYSSAGEILITGSPYAQSYAHSRVINASAVEYTQRAFGYEGTVKGAAGPACGLVEDTKANPYVQGLLLNWNLLASYVFDGSRDQSTGNARIDGLLDNYIDFWQNNGTTWVKATQPQFYEHWIAAANATIFDPEGYNLESKDALGIYSAILLGYNKTLKIAEAVNSRYYEIGFDGFEDRDYDNNANCIFYHFRFGEPEDLSFGSENAHTGKYSLLVGPSSGKSRSSKVTNNIDHTLTDHAVPYLVQQQELISTHTFEVSATEDNRYVLTAWVKESVTGQSQILSYDNASVNISGVTITNLTEKRSNIIDGWQRIEIDFTIPAMTTGSGTALTIELENTGTNNVYFDDVRIQPYNSEMVSYVINPIDLRLWATLDSRNFATFYQYDEEGSLIRIIQETERGRVTVQENRAGIRITQ